MSETLYHVSANPHVRDNGSTQKIMLDVIIALLPATIFGIYIFGASAALTVAISVATCVVVEYIYQKLMKQPITVGDLSAALTGLLLALNLPSGAPFWMPILGGIFAIIVVKQVFGGLGQNFMNPALGARCFLMISFAARMTTFTYDGVTTATPLAVMEQGKSVDVMKSFLGFVPGTIVKTGENSVRVYFTINDEPGGIYAIEDSKDATSATLETVYEPTGDIKNTGCMSDVVVDEDGTIYFANDSKYIMSVGKKVEDTKKSDVITVKPVTKTVKSTRSVKLTWKKKKSAKGYVIYAKAGKGKYKKVTTVGKKTSKTIKVNKDSSYKFKVKPYKLTKKNKKKYFKAYAVKAKFGSKTVKVTFKNVTGYASYKVQMKAGKAAYKTVKTTTKGGTITYTKKKAKVGTTYKFRLKGINKVNGKTVSVTIK